MSAGAEEMGHHGDAGSVRQRQTYRDTTMFDTTLMEQILALVPAHHLPTFFDLATREGVTKE